MVKLGLKCALNDVQLEDRLKHNPDILEFHLNEDDLFGVKFDYLINKIEEVTSKGIKVVLHQPMKIKGRWLDVNKRNCIEEDYLRITTRLLVDLCKKYDLKTVIHINYVAETGLEFVLPTRDEAVTTVFNMIGFINEFDPEKKYIVFENGTSGIGGYFKDLYLVNLLKETDLPLCMDISHLAISINRFDDSPNHLNTENDIIELNDYIFKILSLLENNIKYYHVVDSKADNDLHDSLALGEGVVDWSRLKGFISKKDHIFEIGLSNFNNCDEMLTSYDYLKNIN